VQLTGVPGTIKKLINNPVDVVDELLEAFVAAHGDIVSLGAPRVISRAHPAGDKVGVTIGGGSGHEPAMLGYVGVGLADTSTAGNIFAAPSPHIIAQSIRLADHGLGVLLAYGNYMGDVLNCRLAIQAVAAEGIDVRTVFVSDDVASAPSADTHKRRGIAGDIIVFKVAGAAAERGLPLDEVERLTRQANASTRSMGVALSSPELPGAAAPTFESPPGWMEVGLGVHGEAGISREPLGSADDVGRMLTERVLDDGDFPSGSRVSVLINGLGATPPLEQYLVYRAARQLLEERGISVARSYVGEFITSLQMAGLSVTITLLDDELLSLLNDPAKSVRFVE
jgi:dihydroxyacetone kinase